MSQPLYNIIVEKDILCLIWPCVCIVLIEPKNRNYLMIWKVFIVNFHPKQTNTLRILPAI